MSHRLSKNANSNPIFSCDNVYKILPTIWYVLFPHLLSIDLSSAYEHLVQRKREIQINVFQIAGGHPLSGVLFIF